MYNGEVKEIIVQTILDKLENECARLGSANRESNRGAVFSAPNADKQRDTTGFEAAHLAKGYAHQVHVLTRQIDELKDMLIEDFTDQEIDVGALVDVEMEGQTDRYFILNCAGGTEVPIANSTVTVITPESPLGKALMNKVQHGFMELASGMEGVIVDVL